MNGLPADDASGKDRRSTVDVEAASLRSVVESDLPLLRAHRNKESTRRWLEHQSLITEAQQNVWYQGGGAVALRIIEYQGKPIGLARIDSSGANEVLVGLDVFEQYRGMGLGYSLFRLVCSEAAKLGSPLALWVFAENLPAVSIYRKSGFVEDPNFPVRYLPRIAPEGDPDALHPYVKMVLQK